MFTKTKQLLLVCGVLAASTVAVVACSSDDTSNNGTSSGNPLNPTDSGASSSGDTGTSSGGDSGSDGGGCINKPAGCFCGTPTTQVQFLNRCTNATALPVTLTVKPATTTDIP